MKWVGGAPQPIPAHAIAASGRMRRTASRRLRCTTARSLSDRYAAPCRFDHPAEELAMAFHGRVALVTGAASGMGRLAARRQAAAGAQVAILKILAELPPIAP